MEHDPGSGQESGRPESGRQEADRQEGTGEPRVDAALARLAGLDDLPVASHPAIYEQVHEQLVEVLGELHSGTQGR